MLRCDFFFNTIIKTKFADEFFWQSSNSVTMSYGLYDYKVVVYQSKFAVSHRGFFAIFI